MKTRKVLAGTAIAMLALAGSLRAQSSTKPQADDTVPVTVENFIRAETDFYFSEVALKEGRFGKFEHHREVSDVNSQTIIRMNRDTLYSAVVVDLDAGPATVTLPDAGKRFMSMQIVNEDQYSLPAIYKPGKHVLTKEDIGTRYVIVGVRTLVDPNDPADLESVHRLQDGLKIEQKNPGSKCRNGTQSVRKRYATR